MNVFTAALAWRLGAGTSLAEAAGYAARVGAAAVTKAGRRSRIRRPRKSNSCDEVGHPESPSGGRAGRVGLGDETLVCDAGMPIPAGPRVVDLAFRAGVPPFAEVFAGLVDELVLEGATVAKELRGDHLDLVERPFANLHFVPHERRKKLSAGARLIVRTGEASPYANVLLRCWGVLLRGPETGRGRHGRPCAVSVRPAR